MGREPAPAARRWTQRLASRSAPRWPRPWAGGPSGPRLERCSFCGRPQAVAGVLLAGRGEARICERCVGRATSLMREAREATDAPPEGESGPHWPAAPAGGD
jgi:hypothetical protein